MAGVACLYSRSMHAGGVGQLWLVVVGIRVIGVIRVIRVGRWMQAVVVSIPCRQKAIEQYSNLTRVGEMGAMTEQESMAVRVGESGSGSSEQ